MKEVKLKDVQKGLREVIFVHERGHEMLMIKEQWDLQKVRMMAAQTGGANLNLVDRPVFKSHKGDWTFKEMEILSNLVVFEEKAKLQTRTGKETFKNEGLAVYDTIAGMLKFGPKKEQEIAKSIFEKMFPRLSLANVYAHIL
jgi:hypothetical protein